MTVHLTLVAGLSNRVLLVDTVEKGILDSACTKTVAGRTWAEEYFSLLNEKDSLKAEQSSKEGTSYFRFGKESRSRKVMKLPILLYGRKTEIEVVVEVNHQ